MPPEPVALDGPVAVLAIAPPPVNAMGRALMAALGGCLEGAAADPAVRAIVLPSGLPGMWSDGAGIRELHGLAAAGCAEFVALGQGLFARPGGIRAFLEKRPARFEGR